MLYLMFVNVTKKKKIRFDVSSVFFSPPKLVGSNAILLYSAAFNELFTN